jgi:hypothetical protein
MVALADGAVDVGQMISSMEVLGLSLLTTRPIAADDADTVTELFIKVYERLLGTNDRVVVAGALQLAQARPRRICHGRGQHWGIVKRGIFCRGRAGGKRTL